MVCSTPGFHVLYHLLELAQTYVHWLNDANQPSYPLLHPSPPAFNLSQHQGLIQWVQLFASGGQRTRAWASASVLPVNIQGWFPLAWTGWISCTPRDFQESSPAPQFEGINSSTLSHQFIYTQPSIWFNSHIHTWLLEKPQLGLHSPLLAKWCLCFLIHCLGLSAVNAGNL